LTVILHRASRVLSHIYRQALADSGISLPDYQVLRALVNTGPPYALHPAEIARQCGQTKSTMTHRLDLLEQRQLVRRTSDPSHRARVLVELTPAGHDSWRAAQQLSAQAEEHAMASLADADKHQLTELLATLLAHPED
jgi:DNA-binding MarR family transcriptional regulator